MPGNDVVDTGGHVQAAAGGVGAVDKDLVVDPPDVSAGGIRHVNKPAPAKTPLHGGVADAVSFG